MFKEFGLDETLTYESVNPADAQQIEMSRVGRHGRFDTFYDEASGRWWGQ